jgi:hypothetical protein
MATPLKTLKPGMGLYEVLYWPKEAPDKSKPYAVVNIETRDVNGRWHATEAQAKDQLAAMYARMGDKAKYKPKGGAMHENSHFALAFAEDATVEKDGLLWVEAMPAKTWHTEFWGDVPITEEKLRNFEKNFHERVRGIDILSDFDHGMDRSKGNRASGSFKDVAVKPREDGTPTLFVGIEPTPTALAEVKDGEWKYFSLEWEDEWRNEETGDTHNDVITGGGFTNKPIAKGMAPINFSEVFEERDPKQFAVWSSAYVNNLPDSSFAWIEPGGSKVNGKTTPSSKRHLPYKDANGNVDLPHVRNMLARVKQVKGIPPAVVSRVTTLGERLLKAKSMSEVMMIEAECAPEEFQEPGTGLIDPGVNPDDSPPNRIESPPNAEDGSIEPRPVSDPNKNKGGENMQFSEEQLTELRGLLELEDDTELEPEVVLAKAKAFSEELTPLRELRKKHEAKKKFAEDYPEEANRLADLQERDRQAQVKSFSESFASRRLTVPKGEGEEVKNEPTTKGFSGKVINALEETAKAFSEGSGGLADVKNVVDAILDNGIVDYGTTGSDRQPDAVDDVVVPEPGSQAARKVFSEKVDEIRKNDELSFEAAFDVAAERYPELAEAWRQPPVRS